MQVWWGLDLVFVSICAKVQRFFHYRRSLWVKLVLTSSA